MKVMRKLSFAALVIVGSSVLTGCTNFGIGNAEYKCTGIPEETDQGGVKCVSARKVYELTEQPGPVRIDEMTAAGKGSQATDEEKAKPKPPVDLRAGNSDPLAASPINNDPIPIRSRAKIMRIWVAPWESTDGDLNVTGLVFTELEGRRWNIGSQEEPAAPSLKPLQSIQSIAEDGSARTTPSK